MDLPLPSLALPHDDVLAVVELLSAFARQGVRPDLVDRVAVRFDANGLPTHLVHADGHRLLTNLAFGGPDRRTIYVTDSLNGEILTATLPVAGKLLYGLR